MVSDTDVSKRERALNRVWTETLVSGDRVTQRVRKSEMGEGKALLVRLTFLVREATTHVKLIALDKTLTHFRVRKTFF